MIANEKFVNAYCFLTPFPKNFSAQRRNNTHAQVPAYSITTNSTSSQHRGVRMPFFPVRIQDEKNSGARSLARGAAESLNCATRRAGRRGPRPSRPTHGSRPVPSRSSRHPPSCAPPCQNSGSIRLRCGPAAAQSSTPEQRNEAPGGSPCRQRGDESRELLCPQFGSDGRRVGGKTQRGRWLSTRERESAGEFVAENRVGGQLVSSPVAGSPLQLLYSLLSQT